MDVNKKDINQRLKLMEINQPNSVKLKMTGHKLRSCENWQGTLKQKGVKQT